METIEFGIPGIPFSTVRLPLNPDVAYEEYLKIIANFREQYIAILGDNVALTQPAQRAPQGNPVGGQRETRADKYPVVPGMQCDQCGGPVGRYPKTGRMTSDKGVCLGRCRDEGRYAHTVGWLNDEEPDAGPF